MAARTRACEPARAERWRRWVGPAAGGCGRGVRPAGRAPVWTGGLAVATDLPVRPWRRPAPIDVCPSRPAPRTVSGSLTHPPRRSPAAPPWSPAPDGSPTTAAPVDTCRRADPRPRRRSPTSTSAHRPPRTHPPEAATTVSWASPVAARATPPSASRPIDHLVGIRARAAVRSDGVEGERGARRGPGAGAGRVGSTSGPGRGAGRPDGSTPGIRVDGERSGRGRGSGPGGGAGRPGRVDVRDPGRRREVGTCSGIRSGVARVGSTAAVRGTGEVAVDRGVTRRAGSIRSWAPAMAGVRVRVPRSGLGWAIGGEVGPGVRGRRLSGDTRARSCVRGSIGTPAARSQLRASAGGAAVTQGRGVERSVGREPAPGRMAAAVGARSGPPDGEVAAPGRRRAVRPSPRSSVERSVGRELHQVGWGGRGWSSVGIEGASVGRGGAGDVVPGEPRPRGGGGRRGARVARGLVRRRGAVGDVVAGVAEGLGGRGRARAARGSVRRRGGGRRRGRGGSALEVGETSCLRPGARRLVGAGEPGAAGWLPGWLPRADRRPGPPVELRGIEPLTSSMPWSVVGSGECVGERRSPGEKGSTGHR